MVGMNIPMWRIKADNATLQPGSPVTCCYPARGHPQSKEAVEFDVQLWAMYSNAFYDGSEMVLTWQHC